MRTRAGADHARTEGTSVTMLGALPPWRGVSVYTEQLLGALAARDQVELEAIDFSALYPGNLYPGGDPKGEETSASPLPNVRVRKLLAWYNPLSWVWAGATLRGRVVHAQWWSYILAPVYIVVLTIARMRGRKVVMTLHNVAPHDAMWWQRTMYKAVFRLADLLVVHAEHNKRALLHDYPGARERISVVPMGLHAKESVVSRANARRELGFDDDVFIVLAFGNIRPYKGIDVLLRALKLLIDDGRNVRVVIAGTPWGSFGSHQRVIEELSLNEHLVLKLEYIPNGEVATLFGAADLAVYPYTEFDAQSAAATLGLAFGIPLIVTDVGGLPDFVDDERAIVPPRDADALAQAVARMIDDHQLRAKLAADSQRIAKRSSWLTIAAQTLGIYESVAQGRNAVQITAGGEQWP